MMFTIRLVVLFSLLTGLCLARTWSGDLVDSKCFASEERNVNPTDTLTNVDRDRNREIRYCIPTRKTKSFAMVQSDWRTFQFDSAGNAKAAELVQKVGKTHSFDVTVSGELVGNAIRVDSITPPAGR